MQKARMLLQKIRRRLTTRVPDWQSSPGQSAFWRHIGDQHARALDQFGPERMKRHQALQYFTWQWGATAGLRDAQLRFLLLHQPVGAWVRAWRGPVTGDWSDMPWSPLKRRIYVTAVRLLWEYALVHGDADVMGLSEPELGSPLPVIWRDRLISQDLANTALEVRTMRPVLNKPHHFLEVGAGYGRTAYALLSLYPNARYTIVDIEPALSIARWYLTRLFDGDRLAFLTPDQMARATDVDLALSISTFPEMLPGTVARYLREIDRLARHVYLKQWTSWRNGDDLVRMTMADYPYPSRWRRIRWNRAPVQTRFTEGLWSIRT